MPGWLPGALTARAIQQRDHGQILGNVSRDGSRKACTCANCRKRVMVQPLRAVTLCELEKGRSVDP
jgi:hypothetical protein